MQVTGAEWVYIIVIYACCGLAAAYAMMQAVAINSIDIMEATKADAKLFGCQSDKLTDKLLPDQVGDD